MWLNFFFILTIELIGTEKASSSVSLLEKEMEMLLKFTFVRHGQTNWRYEDRFLGPVDPALNEQGKKDANKASSYLAQLPYTWILWTSPYRRTKETSSILQKRNKFFTWSEIDDLKERYYGDYRLDPKNPPDLEKDDEFHKRVDTVVKRIEAFNEPYKLLIVSHAQFFKALCNRLNVPNKKIECGDVFHFYKGKGEWHLVGPYPESKTESGDTPRPGL
jgi:broad specificity phosphatase PhoE